MIRTVVGLVVLALASVTTSDAQEGRTTPVPDDLVLWGIPYYDRDPAPVQERSDGQPDGAWAYHSSTTGAYGGSFRGFGPEELAQSFRVFLQTLGPTFDTILDEVNSTTDDVASDFVVEEIDVHVQVTAEGRLFVAAVGGMAGVTLKFRRSRDGESSP